MIDNISQQVARLEAAISHHQLSILELEAQLTKLKSQQQKEPPLTISTIEQKYPLSLQEYSRYGRQLILPIHGLTGQLSLKNAKVLIIGAGGLGCPAAIYLAGAGIGHLGIVDGDTVEVSNLHRQILHGGSIGENKAQSVVRACTTLNPLVKHTAYQEHLTSSTSLELFAQYDLILDCTDNPATRYLISDTAVLAGKPLISASALRLEGQLIILNNPAVPPGQNGGPCYRCIFPNPPPPESVTTCGEGGILGPVVGIMGVLQALEAIKLLTGQIAQDEKPSMLLFSANGNPQFRSVRMRTRKKDCAACSENATVTRESLESSSLDYVLFCGGLAGVNVLTKEERVSAREFAEEKREHLVVDVREKVQFDLCKLDGSVNLPFSEVVAAGYSEDGRMKLQGRLDEIFGKVGHDEMPVHVVCRLGNDSQIAVCKFKDMGFDHGGKRWIGDITGGLRAWREEVDGSFPDY